MASPGENNRFHGSLTSFTVVLLFAGALLFGGMLVLIAWWHTRSVQEEVMVRAAESYAEAIGVFRSFYRGEVANRALEGGLELTHDFRRQPGTLPIPSSMMLDLTQRINSLGHSVKVSIVSPYPYPWRGKRPLEQFEERALGQLQVSSERSYSEFDNSGEQELLRYAVPLRMARACVDCHNHHPDSPKRDWKVGDVRGIEVISMEVDRFSGRNQLGLAYLVSFIVFSFIAAFSVILWLVHKNEFVFLQVRLKQRNLQRALTELRFFKRALDQHAIVSIADVDGRITYANERFCEISGYPRKEVIGADHRLLRSGTHDESFYQQLWETILAGKVWHGEIHNRRSSGSSFWVNSTIVPFLSASGKPFQYIAISTDVSERKRMEEENERSRRFLEGLTNAIGEGVYAVDELGRCLYINPEAERLLRWGPGELLGRHILELISMAEGDDRSAPLADALASGEPFRSEEIIFLRQGGEQFDAEVVVVPMAVSGRAVGSVVAFRDITERKIAEQALRDSEERFRHVASTAHEAIITVDTDHLVRFWNQAAVETFGYSGEEIVGTSFDRLIPAGMVAACHAGFRAAVERGSLSNKGGKMEVVALRKGGEQIIVEISLSTWVSSGGRFFTAMARDVTERKWMLEELAHAIATAESANRSKSEFLANMSHEIRTPMNAIIGLSHLALQSGLPPRQHGYLARIQGAARNLLGIINDILDFSKIEAGRMSVELIEFDLDELIEQSCAVIASRAAEKGLRLIVERPPGLSACRKGDPLRIGQIVTNLANNAVKFTEQGEVVISLAEGEGDLVTISVSDSGIGLSSEQIGRLFHSFVQADASTTRKYGGTGLGLAISRRLAELMDGELGVESEPGSGSRFFIQLPLARCSEAEDRVPPQWSGVRVVLAEGDRRSREAISSLLTILGLDVATSAGCSDALDRLASNGRGGELLLVDADLDGAERIVDQVLDDTRIVLKPDPVFICREGEPVPCSGEWLEIERPVTLHALQRLLDQWRPLDGSVSRGRSAEGAKQPALAGLRVLLAEDNLINQEVAIELLETVGVEVELVVNGADAVARLSGTREDDRFDLVLMDLQMPVMDGYEACRRLRQAGYQGPIVALTAHALSGDRERSIEAGMNDHLTKPFDPPELYSVLSRWGGDGGGQAGSAVAGRSGQAAVEVDSLPLQLPGIDLAAGLRQVHGNRALYRRLLIHFYDEWHSSASSLSATLNAGQAPALHAVHSLKGVSATLGAGQLSDAAAQVETVLRDGKMVAAEDLQRLTANLAEVLDGIGGWVGTAGAGSQMVGGARQLADPAAVDRLLARIGELVAEGDLEANERIGELLSMVEGSPCSAAAAELASLIERFEFDESMVRVEALRAAVAGLASQGTGRE